ncbi:hypothetical protein [Paludisphaera mucosa]|uniref:Uncharacterized protein n=1 Tax=Paludisphaera mucosa TaxID=3030827 RepID=A0ABT6FM80_9BACT|nr:hypothetical protein [Paludisphaera mucosa]MDG3008488.1 hypothetical protein [Paludisphaera mucosa]
MTYEEIIRGHVIGHLTRDGETLGEDVGVEVRGPERATEARFTMPTGVIGVDEALVLECGGEKFALTVDDVLTSGRGTDRVFARVAMDPR